MKRPRSGQGSTVTTPRSGSMMKLLGSGLIVGSVALSRDETQAIKKLYGYEPEKPTKKPAAPKAPDRADFKSTFDYEDAVRKHDAAMRAHANWQDPMPMMQAGADRNATRHAEADGLRLLAWLAKFVPVGEDPLKTLVQAAADAGWDVDASDIAWAEDEVEDADEDEEVSDAVAG